MAIGGAAGAQSASTAKEGAAKAESAAGPQSTKQMALALETEKLVAMATQLKASVDKTNKNILSLAVVQQAEQIERFAHAMKTEEKK